MTTTRPFVSFVIPAYNVADTVGLTIESALSQNWPESRREIIVVDNGSTDRTVEVVRQYPVSLVFERKRGRSAPRNRGIQVANPKAEMIASVDADCVVPPDFLNSLTAAMDSPWIAAAQARVRKAGQPVPSEKYKLAYYYLPFLDSCAVVFRRSAYENAQGFDEELARCVDMDFSFRLLACGYAFAWVPKVVVTKHHDLSQGQAFHRGFENGHATYQIYRKWRPWINRSNAGIALDRVASLTKPFVASVTDLRSAGLLSLAEATGRVFGYAYHRFRGVEGSRSALASVTALPAILGSGRFLLFRDNTSVLYDAEARRVDLWGATQTAVVRAWADGQLDDSAIAERVGHELAVGATKVASCIAGLRTRLAAARKESFFPAATPS